MHDLVRVQKMRSTKSGDGSTLRPHRIGNLTYRLNHAY